MALVDYFEEGALATVTLNRPPVNALSSALVEELDRALTRAQAPAVRAVIITGAPHFSGGANISEFASGGPGLGRGLAGAILHLESLAKPTIAAVNGYALGGGLELAMGCDFRYLAEDARVGQPEIKLGIIPGAGGTQRLARLVGLARARDLVYSGRQVAAAQALAMGLADQVVPAGDLMAAARDSALEWAKGATAAISAAKRAIGEGWGRPLEEALRVERHEFEAVSSTNDAAEGIAAFLGKRRPAFSGN